MYLHPDKESTDRNLIYEPDHIEMVMAEIRVNFNKYFDKFLAMDAGTTPSSEDFRQAQTLLGVTVQRNHKSSSHQKQTTAFRDILAQSINKFEDDSEPYQTMLDPDFLEESEDDTSAFKNQTLKKDCPILRQTLHSSAKELDKFRTSFNIANADDLFGVIHQLSDFAVEYAEKFNTVESYEAISSLSDLNLDYLEGVGYANVIGYGISSHLLYKNNPELFPHRNPAAIWALWYLTNHKTFDCHENSEFLMIDGYNIITSHNYFYPFNLYSWYAFKLYKMLKVKAEELGVYIDTKYRYVAVDAFTEFIYKVHESEIMILSSQIPNGGLGYYV